MAEFILKDWYGKEQTFDKETIYVRGKDGDLLPFTYGTGDPEESPEMIYYRSLAETLMKRDAKYFTGDNKIMRMKNFITSDGAILGNLPNYSFAGFNEVEGMSFDLVVYVNENAFYDCPKLKVVDITATGTLPMVAFLDGSLNNCPSIESIIIRAGEQGLTIASVLKTHGSSNDEFYVYVPSAYYDTVMANWNENMIPKERYRKLEEYPSVDHWHESYVVKFYDSDGSTLLKTEEYVYGTIPSYTPTKSGYEFAGWIPEPAAVTGPASYTANWVEYVTFANSSWEKISEVCNNGRASEYFAVGDKRPITLNYDDGTSETINFTIVDMGVDPISDGKAPLTIMADNIVSISPTKLASSYQNSILFFGNDLAKSFLNRIFAGLPLDLQAVIKPYKYNAYSNDFTNVFIAHSVNLGVSHKNWANPDTPIYDAKYKYFVNGASIKRTKLNDATFDNYWTAAKAYGTSSSSGYKFVVIDGTKAMSAVQGYSDSHGIVPCFCI